MKTMEGKPIEYWILAIVQIFSIAHDGEDIPLNALFGMPGEVTPEDFEWARAQLKQIGKG